MAERKPIYTGHDSRNRLRSKKEAEGNDAANQPAKEYEATATEKAALTGDLGSGKAARGGGAGMPKQEPGETPAAFGARLRRWRESQPKAVNQAKALSGK